MGASQLLGTPAGGPSCAASRPHPAAYLPDRHHTPRKRAPPLAGHFPVHLHRFAHARHGCGRGWPLLLLRWR